MNKSGSDGAAEALRRTARKSRGRAPFATAESRISPLTRSDVCRRTLRSTGAHHREDRANQEEKYARMTPASVMLRGMRTPTRQLAFDLRDSPRWGGRRAGAGRRRGPNPRDPHRTRPALEAQHPCHVTLKVRSGLPSLRSAKLVRELERSLAAACQRGRFRVAHYSIQHDHVHLIVEAAGRHALACGMKSIAARVARPRIVGAVVHRVDPSDPPCAWSGTPPGCSAPHVAARDRLAPPRADRSVGGAGRAVIQGGPSEAPLAG
jgi:hypothetical protein